MLKEEKLSDLEMRKLSVGEIIEQLKILQGKVLTIVEATYSNVNQCTAVKNLVKGVFSDRMHSVTVICYPSLPIITKEDAAGRGIDVEKVEREAEEVKV